MDSMLRDELPSIPFVAPLHMGGKRRSLRQILDELRRTNKQITAVLMTLRKQRWPNVKLPSCCDPIVVQPAVHLAVQPVDQPVPVGQPATDERPVLKLCPSKRRRLIQFMYEALGAPDEINAFGDNVWEGKHGIINQIRQLCWMNSKSWRVRSVVRNVIEHVRAQMDAGIEHIDAGERLHGSNSGRHRKLTESEDRLVARALNKGMGIQMTHAIVNHNRAADNKVSFSTVWRSASRGFGGSCHNRPTKKTGSKDEDSIWAKARLAIGLQLQQQFRDNDQEGEHMVGVPVVKLFGGVPYTGKVIAYDPAEKYYKVRYDDGDENELEYHELRIKEWKRIDRRAVLWCDEKHKKVIFGMANRHEWLFFVDPNNTAEFMKEQNGGVKQQVRPRTKAKYMGECRGIFGVMMRELPDGTLEGDRMTPLDYTGQKVVGPVAYEKLFRAEIKRVSELKTTGTRSSVHWKQAGEGLEGGPYQAKFGSRWKQEVKAALGRGSGAVRNVTDLMDHCISEGNRLFANTPFKDNWVLYHDALSSWWSEGAQSHMKEKDFVDRQIRGLGHTNADTRYYGKLPGDTPEYMPLDSNLFADLETAVRFNVAATSHLPGGHPNKFELAKPASCWSAVCRTWEYAPTSERIVQDIQRVFTAIDQVVAAKGTAVDFHKLRHGRRLLDHQTSSRSKRRSVSYRENNDLETIEGLHPTCKQYIIDLCNE